MKHQNSERWFFGSTRLVLLLVLLLANPTQAAILAGRVQDAATRSALAGAQIQILGTNYRTVSDPSGAFALGGLPEGSYTVLASYLGYVSQQLPATLSEGQTTQLPINLELEVRTLDAMIVEASAMGQALALQQQRAAQNTTSIISSDLSGQFPDKTIADAVKRLPGVTVETDADTGGSEGRYVTVRGMSSDFNAVAINGMRVAVSNFDQRSRSVPLDVVSSKIADSIQVTKALRPDQDGDSIGGLVEISTRSAFDRDGLFTSVEGGVGFSALLEEYENYPLKNPIYEGSATYGNLFGENRDWGFLLHVDGRARPFVKQRVSTQGWTSVNSSAGRGFLPTSLALQEFFDDVTSLGASANLEHRYGESSQFRINAAFSERDTQRGRQRQVFTTSRGAFSGAPVLTDDTFTEFTRTNNRIDRQVRDFKELQRNINLSLQGEHRTGALTLGYVAGLNRGSFDGDEAEDLQAQWRASGNRITVSNSGDEPWTPQIAHSIDKEDPSRYGFNFIDRSTLFVDDEEYLLGIDGKIDTTLFGAPGFWKIGGKARFRTHENEVIQRDLDLDPDVDWNLEEVIAPDGRILYGSVLADYGSESSVDDTYDYGFFIDPRKVREAANALEAAGLLTPFGGMDVISALGSSKIREDVYSGYAMGQFNLGPGTLLAGTRVEFTRVRFSFSEFMDPSFINDPFAASLSDLREVETTESYVDLMPGVHYRLDVTKNLVARTSFTRSISRPGFGQMNPATRYSVVGDLSVGNPDLDRVRSNNLDIGLDWYFAKRGVLSAGFFHKRMKGNPYTVLLDTELRGEPVTTDFTVNSDRARVYGIEIAFDQQFTFLPAPLDGFGITANTTLSQSRVDLGNGLLEGAEIPLFDQVGETANIGLYYDKHGLRARASVLYRSGSLLAIDQADIDSGDTGLSLSRYRANSVVFDFTASYQITPRWQVYTEFQNLLNEPNRAYNGDKSLRLDFNEFSDWVGYAGVRWSL